MRYKSESPGGSRDFFYLCRNADVKTVNFRHFQLRNLSEG